MTDYRYESPTGPGSGVLTDEQDRQRTTHMKLVGSPPAGLGTVIHLPSGKVRLVQVYSTDDELDPDLLCLQGGSPHVVGDDVAAMLTAAGLGAYLTPI